MTNTTTTKAPIVPASLIPFARNRSGYALQLAQAALVIAKTNHFLVGFDASGSQGTSLMDWQDARQILIDAERQLGKYRSLDRAFAVLSSECMRQHNVDLSR